MNVEEIFCDSTLCIGYKEKYIVEVVNCGNSSNSGKILTLKKEIVRIMAVAQCRTSCRSLFKQEILPAHGHKQEVFKQIIYTQH
jgi:hypothetical protein